ncbi:MAG: Hint domain-containing protein [Gemmobacter sp.]
MPVIARYDFDDADTVAADSALANGAQNGLYTDGAASVGGRAVLDGVNDKVKIQAEEFQLAQGTLEIQFTQAAHVGSGPNTVLSRDSTGETPGGYRVEVLADGSITVTHEGAGTSTTFTTGPGFLSPGDEVQLTYSWDENGPGQLSIANLTSTASYSEPVPAGLTMNMGPAINQKWMIGAGQSNSDAGFLNNLDSYFQGSVEYFEISNTVDNLGDGTPTPQPDTAVTDEDTPVTIPVLDNDTDPQGQPLTVIGGEAPNGTVVINPDGTITYTPDQDYNGQDIITYTVRDPDGNTATSTVTVTINPVNDDPVANPDTAATGVGVPVIIPVLANDTDVDGDPLSILGIPTATEGTVTVNPDGTITFTPPTGFIGTSTITYAITDGNGGTDTSTVTVSVGLPPPVRDGIVNGTPDDDLIDLDYVDVDGDRIDAEDALIPGDGPNDDRVFGREGNDTIFGGLGSDTIFGGPGDDSILGGPGDDVLYGDSGDDTIFGGDGSDRVYGGDGNDFIDTSGGGAAPLPDRGYPGLYPADADPLNDRDTVFGGRGDDTIFTGDDNDVIYGGNGNDYVDAGFDDDLVFGGRGNDTLIGGEGADTIYGDQGNDVIYGGLGPTAPDAVNIRDDQGDLRPDNGTDLLFGGAGNDTIYGLDDNDTIYGDDGDDLLDGGIDNDLIFGGAGNDTIIGGQGADTMFGGADRDLFIINRPGDGIGDVIDGNEEGDDFDTLDLRGAGPLRVTFADDNPENGSVTFYDPADPAVVTGTLTFVNIENVIPCFTPGTLIATPRGEVPVEELRVGDRVVSRDNGIQDIRWVGAKHLDWAALCANPHLKPVLIRQGSLGNGLPERDMMVSPNHRMLVANDRTALYFEDHEVLVAAKHLVGANGVHSVDAAGTTYLHMMFDRHEVVLANGAWTESFQPGDYTLKGMGNAQRTEIFEIFPELATETGLAGYQAARRTLKKHEAALLLR